MKSNELLMIYGTEYKEMAKQLLEAADLAGRIPDAGSRIGLKPNLVSPSEASWGATTHPEIAAGTIEYLKEHGFENLVILEGSWVGDKTADAFEVCGYDRLVREYGVEFIDTQKDSFHTKDCAGMELEICDSVEHLDFLINLPVLKGHCQTVMTCALKNCKGCLPDKEKRRFHSEGLQKPIAALGAYLKPQLTIVDSICGDLNFEEGGTPIYTNRMYLGTDPVQIDAYGCMLMGLNLSQVPYIKMAEQFGGGSTAVSEADIVKLNEPEASASYPAPSGTVASLTKNVRQDSACSACYASLVRALYNAKRSGVRVTAPIYIGQAFQGQSLDGIGIGRCCSGASCPVKGCPPTAEAILAVLKGQE